MNILITICARGGSKGVPDKNIRDLAGKPLLAYSIETAHKFRAALPQSRVDLVLSTDSDKIKAKALEVGLPTNYSRPEELATDKAGKIGAIADVLFFSEKENQLRYDFVLDLDVTAPLRTLDDLLTSLEMMENNKEAINLFSVSSPHRNPYFNMVELKEDGFAKLIKPLQSNVLSRQAAPQVYDMNASFYFYRRNFFDLAYDSAITDKSLIFHMDHVCFDIDNLLDYEIMDYLLREEKLGFTL